MEWNGMGWIGLDWIGLIYLKVGLKVLPALSLKWT